MTAIFARRGVTWDSAGLARMARRLGADGIVGWAIVAATVVVACFSGVIAPGGASKIVAIPLIPPSGAYLLGTDDVGRSIGMELIAGDRVTLIAGVASALISLIVGGLVGGIAGYYGGVVDGVLMRVAELFQVIPGLLLALVIAALLGTKLQYVIIAIAITIWPQMARLARAEVMRLSHREYVDAALLSGLRHFRVLLSEILPNALSPIIALATLEVGTAILIQSALSFLGLGDPNNPSWGDMLHAAQLHLSSAWWLSVFPGLAILVVVVGFNLAGDSLQRLLDVRRDAAFPDTAETVLLLGTEPADV